VLFSASWLVDYLSQPVGWLTILHDSCLLARLLPFFLPSLSSASSSRFVCQWIEWPWKKHAFDWWWVFSSCYVGFYVLHFILTTRSGYVVSEEERGGGE
jgi:hypothetical protein